MFKQILFIFGFVGSVMSPLPADHPLNKLEIAYYGPGWTPRGEEPEGTLKLLYEYCFNTLTKEDWVKIFDKAHEGITSIDNTILSREHYICLILGGRFYEGLESKAALHGFDISKFYSDLDNVRMQTGSILREMESRSYGDKSPRTKSIEASVWLKRALDELDAQSHDSRYKTKTMVTRF